jgi:hypothetical protein
VQVVEFERGSLSSFWMKWQCQYSRLMKACKPARCRLALAGSLAANSRVSCTTSRRLRQPSAR